MDIRKSRDWLEYSVKADSAFCCRKYNVGTSRVDAFVITGYCNWKHSSETDRISQTQNF